MSKKICYIWDTNLCQRVLSDPEVDLKDHISVVEDYIFNILHQIVFKIRYKYVTLHSQNLIVR